MVFCVFIDRLLLKSPLTDTNLKLKALILNWASCPQTTVLPKDTCFHRSGKIKVFNQILVSATSLTRKQGDDMTGQKQAWLCGRVALDLTAMHFWA